MNDDFTDLARFYEPLMEHVDYDRWYAVVGAVAALVPSPFLHADLACGTATLVRKLRRSGWNSFGFDLSPAMVRAGRKAKCPPVLAAANLRALPIAAGAVDYATCLFDSINFLLDLDHVREAFRQVARVLRPGGVFYFDVITEKMVLDHFADQSWTENNGSFSTSWSTEYDRKSSTAETRIQVSRGPLCIIRERVYEQAQIEEALAEAGLTLLGVRDAETWKPPRKRKTVRLDFVAAKGRSPEAARKYTRVEEDVRRMLR